MTDTHGLSRAGQDRLAEVVAANTGPVPSFSPWRRRAGFIPSEAVKAMTSDQLTPAQRAGGGPGPFETSDLPAAHRQIQEVVFADLAREAA